MPLTHLKCCQSGRLKMQITRKSRNGGTNKTRISLVQLIWDESATNLQGVKYLCWMDKGYAHLREFSLASCLDHSWGRARALTSAGGSNVEGTKTGQGGCKTPCTQEAQNATQQTFDNIAECASYKRWHRERKISSSRSLTTDRVCNREDCLNPRCCNEDEEGKRVKEDPARTGLASCNCCSCNKGDNNCLPHAIAIAAAPPHTLLLSKFDQNFLSSSQRWLADGSKWFLQLQEWSVCNQASNSRKMALCARGKGVPYASLPFCNIATDDTRFRLS